MNEIGLMGESFLLRGNAFPQYFFAVFPDGHEAKLTGITVTNGESLSDAMEKLRIAIGATKIVLKPEEAQAMVE